MRTPLLEILLCCLATACLADPPLKRLETPGYTIYSDLDSDGIKEAGLRLTRINEIYRIETGNLADTSGKKFPFYLYRNTDDYLSAGGGPGTVGWYVRDPAGGKLMAIAGQTTSLNTWYAVQHEGFHQYAHAVLRDALPAWLNEGLAEYFGEALFTGDGYVTGIIPAWRLQRLQESIQNHKLDTFAHLTALSADQWQQQMNVVNYDQAWSYAQFLMQGQSRKYRPHLLAYLREVAAGRNADLAWRDTLGTIPDLEIRWNKFWTSQPPDPTANLYATAVFQTFVSFLARAQNHGQSFETFEAFRDAANQDQIKIGPRDWLPRSLLEQAFSVADNYGKWSIEPDKTGAPMLLADLKTGTRLAAALMDRAVPQRR